MHRRFFPLLLWILLPSAAVAQSAPTDEETFFELKVRPILAGRCFHCHGGKKTSQGLRVDSRQALLKGGERGPAIVPGKPEESLVIQAVRFENDEIEMPPPPAKRLTESEVADLERWVKEGARWPASKASRGFVSRPHWAFAPVRASCPPEDPSGWAMQPIDRFVAAQWREQHIEPVGLAEKRTLLRRVTFDLTGLPPTPDDLNAFLNDETPEAFAKVVDRLLDSPRYGERWGRHWMDVVRYADTAGDNADYPIPEARLYRDYIIDAFNQDKPYDEFVREQVAGDILAGQGPPGQHADRVVATGFLALSRRYATAPEELWHLTLEDTIETTGRAFLGLTLRCARCHDHKFDPITQRDYYALYGIFASTQFPYAGSEEFSSKNFPRAHFVPLAPPADAAPRLKAYQEQVESLQHAIHELETGEPAQRLAHLKKEAEALTGRVGELQMRQQDEDVVPLAYDLAAVRSELGPLERSIQKELPPKQQALRKLQRPGLPPDLPGAYAVQEGQAHDVPIQLHGDPGQRGPIAPRGVPAVLAGSQPFSIPPGTSGRLALAEWLTRAENPLTARVMVNRIWQYHFGRGLVATSSNFGLRGEEPSHPELLDWLTDQFIKSGWSIKAMHRLIVLSKTYQLASDGQSDAAARDPSNRWLWRHERQRLDAESLRDAMLALSGRLDLSRPGPHPFPPIEQWGWTQHNPFKAVYPSNRRSVFLMTQRLQRHPYLALFDGPDTNASTAERSSSTVPLQALYLMNDPFVQEQAAGLADRLIAASADPQRRVELAHLWAWSRGPQSEETEQAVDYLERYRQGLQAAGTPAAQVEREAWTSFARIVLTSNEFLYVD